MPASDVHVLVGRRVRLRGVWEYDHEVVLRNQARHGRPGVRVLTPLRIAGAEVAVLVDRGWLPYTVADPTRRRAYRGIEQATVEGIVQRPQSRAGWLAPRDVAAPSAGRADAWFRVDVEAIQQQTPFPLLPAWVEQSMPTPLDALPWRGAPPPLTDGPHAGYVLQWWSFATILVVGYGALARRAARGDDGGVVSP